MTKRIRRVIFEPNWSFIEALNAAWEAYRTNGLEAKSNRRRVLEKWANVVGRTKAVSELEQTLSQYKDSSEIEQKLGLTPHIVNELRKAFKKMPTVTPFTKEVNKNLELCKEREQVDNIDSSLDRFLQVAQKEGIDPLSKLIDSFTQANSNLTISEHNIRKLLDISKKANENSFSKLLDWMKSSADLEDFITILKNVIE